MLTESDVWKSNGIMAANCEAELEMSVLMKLVRAIEAEVAARAGQEPFAVTTGYYGGRAVIEPINRAMVIPVNLALYTTPVACPKCGDAEQMYYRDMTERTEECVKLQAKVAELEAKLLDREGMVCGDCDDTGWLENREEGRYPCTCMTEAEPYQLLQAKVAEAARDNGLLRLRVEQRREQLTSAESALSERDARVEEQSEEIERLTNRLNTDSQEFTIICSKETETLLRATITQQAERIAELEQAYKDKDTAATQLVTAMRDMATKVAELNEERQEFLSTVNKIGMAVGYDFSGGLADLVVTRLTNQSSLIEKCEKALKAIIAAWESLPEGKHDARRVGEWLAGPMMRAIRQCRESVSDHKERI